MVSVIIPTYQRENAIERSLGGVIQQTYEDIEIIVVDDNGKGTDHQIATEQNVSKINDDRIRYIVHDENKGGCAARNTGILAAKGEFVAFLDDDDLWSKCFVEALLPYLNNDAVGAVYCDFYSFNGSYTYGLKQTQGYEGVIYQEVLKGWCPASTSLFMVRRSSILEAGMFDDNLKSFQDYDMWLRLSKICEFAHCKQVLVLKYEGFGEQTSRNPQRRETGYRQIVNKYREILDVEEMKSFQSFIDLYYYNTLYRKIVYNYRHNREYKEDLAIYSKKHHSIKDKMHIFLKLHLPDGIYSRLGGLIQKSNKNFIIIKGKYEI